MRRKLAFGAAVVLVVAAAAAGIAIAAGGDDDEPLSGKTLLEASAAALRHTGGGAVVESEVGDEGAAYEVEVRLPDGRQVEVQLNANFEVLGREADDDRAGEDGAGDDD
jgi:uncharacterized membrane protein YkoI